MSCLKLEIPLYLIISYYRTPRDLLQSYRPYPSALDPLRPIQRRYGPRRLQTPYYLQTGLTLYLIIRSINYRISLKLIKITSLITELRQPISLATLVETPRRTYIYNILQTQYNDTQQEYYGGCANRLGIQVQNS